MECRPGNEVVGGGAGCPLAACWVGLASAPLRLPSGSSMLNTICHAPPPPAHAHGWHPRSPSLRSMPRPCKAPGGLPPHHQQLFPPAPTPPRRATCSPCRLARPWQRPLGLHGSQRAAARATARHRRHQPAGLLPRPATATATAMARPRTTKQGLTCPWPAGWHRQAQALLVCGAGRWWSRPRCHPSCQAHCQRPWPLLRRWWWWATSRHQTMASSSSENSQGGRASRCVHGRGRPWPCGMRRAHVGQQAQQHCLAGIHVGRHKNGHPLSVHALLRSCHKGPTAHAAKGSPRTTTQQGKSSPPSPRTTRTARLPA